MEEKDFEEPDDDFDEEFEESGNEAA